MSLLCVNTITQGKRLRISDEEFVQLRDFIYQQCGVHFGESRKYIIENRLANRLKELGLETFGEYHNFLRCDRGKRGELNRLFDAITTNETSFYRNPPQLEVFQEKVLKSILDEQRKKGERSLRLWSAGCSTGEEPYTLAIILNEVLRGEINSWNIKITANDISESALAAARIGSYSEYSLRTTPREIMNRYFDRTDQTYKVKPEIRKMISFGQINLNDRAQLRAVEQSHIVFCRNVIIYFDGEMEKRVIKACYDNLLSGGYLFVGHSESLHTISKAFKPIHHSGAIVYRKES